MQGDAVPDCHFSVKERDGYALVEYRGVFSAEALRGQTPGVAEAVSALDASAVMFDISHTAGQRSVEERASLLDESAAWLSGMSRVAVVARPGQLFAGRPGQSAAAEAGVNMRVFTDRDQAEEWLRASQG
jgi:hypothetical protein